MRKSHMLIAAGVIVLLGTLIWLALPKRTASDASSQPSAASEVDPRAPRVFAHEVHTARSVGRARLHG